MKTSYLGGKNKEVQGCVYHKGQESSLPLWGDSGTCDEGGAAGASGVHSVLPLNLRGGGGGDRSVIPFMVLIQLAGMS